MNEIDLYEISDWGANLECYISLSYNSHPMASNILYANFNTLTANFSLCFHLTERTVFLYEKLLGKYKTVFNSHTERKYILLSKKYQIDYKNQMLHALMCETLPLSEINLSEQELSCCTHALSSNPHKCVMNFLKQNEKLINNIALSQNSSDHAIDLLEGRIDWWFASSNTNEKITTRFIEQKSKLSGFRLSRNSSDEAVHILLNERYGAISWNFFCENPNDHAVDHIISIISENRNDARIVWHMLCKNKNPRVLDILRNNKDKIVWKDFLKNPLCFSYNYEMMRKRCMPIKDEINDIFMRPEIVMATIERERCGDESDFEVMKRINR